MTITDPLRHYQNPVYPHSCPDPFVLKHLGIYWAYCTGLCPDGRHFGVLRSPDLVRWQALGGALEPLPGEAPFYWAPEVTYDNSHFYLYYSVGDEQTMHIRVAVASDPAGPFTDAGKRLTSEPFAIDAHVFQDENGSRWLFYATDYLEHERIGTGTAMDEMVDHFSLAGKPQAVTRARYDWQIFDPQRVEKGGVCWHTLEGPFVLKRKSRYYQMFSGGNFQNASYGVSYATTTNLKIPTEWDQVCDGETSFPVLKSIPDRRVVGPGHNSVIRGPDNRQLYCVYHRWSDDAQNGTPVRAMAIDPLEWVGDRLVVLGPTNDQQPAPNLPSNTGFLESPIENEPDNGWQAVSGEWAIQEGCAVQKIPSPGRLNEVRFDLQSPYFLVETGLRSLEPALRAPGAFGILLDGDWEEMLSLVLLPPSHAGGKTTGIVVRGAGEQRRERSLVFPEDFAADASHLVRLDVNLHGASLSLDGTILWRGALSRHPEQLVLFTRGMAAAFGPYQITYGAQDLFTFGEAAELGWNEGEGTWMIHRQRLLQDDLDAPNAWIIKDAAFTSYELVINARLEEAQNGGGYGIFPLCPVDSGVFSGGPYLRLVHQGESGWGLRLQTPGNERIFTLPADFDPSTDQQFRFRKQAGRLAIALVGEHGAIQLGEIPATRQPTRFALATQYARASFDMARITAIKDGAIPDFVSRAAQDT